MPWEISSSEAAAGDQVESVRASHFPSLALSSAVIDMLTKNPDDRMFENLVEEAIIRCLPAAAL